MLAIRLGAALCLLSVMPAAAGIRRDCRLQCDAAIAACVESGIFQRAQCTRAIRKRCRRHGLAVCAVTTTTTSTSTTIVASIPTATVPTTTSTTTTTLPTFTGSWAVALGFVDCSGALCTTLSYPGSITDTWRMEDDGTRVTVYDTSGSTIFNGRVLTPGSGLREFFAGGVETVDVVLLSATTAFATLVQSVQDPIDVSRVAIITYQGNLERF